MTQLSFTTLPVSCGDLGPESGLPDVLGQANVQNRTRFRLDESDEIYQGYGQRKTAYPYRQQNRYTRTLHSAQVQAAVLENQWLRAEFLPGYGGRLWRLFDKKKGRDILYTNDCLRPSNLAVRNAWFSGGVEWNCGVIGHTPFTMEDIFAARLEKDGCPVLRMYSWERLSGVVYQMDFWLEEKAPALNCHMTVTNPTDAVTPMYWWSNIASPLYPGGRLLVPAHKAYTHREGAVVKVDIPSPEPGLDISHYEQIPTQRDYFFALDEEAPRWIAHLDKEGWGLLHTSTRRLQSRKLFVWGTTDGAARWQEFLTENAGPYLEIQAGLGKTQYGCLPMAPRTSWEWTERYQPLQLENGEWELPFDAACGLVSRRVAADETLQAAHRWGQGLVRLTAQVMHRGTGDAMLENAARAARGEGPLREHLDFASPDTRQQPWLDFLASGQLPACEGLPGYDLNGDFWREQLEKAVKAQPDSWYGHYCLSLLELEAGRMDLAGRALHRSLALRPTPCGLYLAAVYELVRGRRKAAAKHMAQGFALCNGDLAYAKAGLEVYTAAEAWREMLEQIDEMPADLAADSRVRFCRALALHKLGREEDALAELKGQGGLELADIRECDSSIGYLWQNIQYSRRGRYLPIPHFFNFNSMDRVLPREK